MRTHSALSTSLGALIMIAAAFCPRVATAVTPLEAGDGDPVSIGTVRELRSHILDEERPLLVCLPDGYEAGESSYPVLFVLYGDQVRGYLAEAVHVVDRLSGEGSTPQMIVVGVGNVDRYRDLSPIGRRGEESGIEPFSLFVAEELLPFVDSEYRTKNYRMLMGPQAGAGFGLYTLATRPGLFDAFIIENPFAFPELRDALMPTMEELVETGLPSPTFLQVTWADRAGFRDATGTLADVQRLEEMVAEADPPNLTLVTNYVQESEDFLPPLLLKEGLRELFRGHRFPSEIAVSDLESITSYYEDLSERLGFDVDVPRMTLVAKADELARAGAGSAAEEMLHYLIDAYPTNVDGYWQLANLYRSRGDREKALEYYRKCIEIMPNMPPALRYIEELEAQE